jgi:hypothetical protein
MSLERGAKIDEKHGGSESHLRSGLIGFHIQSIISLIGNLV